MNILTLIKSVVVRPSAWRLATSGGAEITAGAGKFLFGSLNAGNLYMAMGSQDSTALRFPYKGGGVGGGVSVPTTIFVSASFSTKDFAATGGEWGRVYLSPTVSEDLTIDTISGLSLVLTLAASGVAGVSMSLIFFGVDRTFMSSISQGRVALPMINFQGVAFSAGTNFNNSFGFTGGGYFIYVQQHQK